MHLELSMKSEIEAISPFVDDLMLKIKEHHCDPGSEFGIELALREALANAVVHGNREDSGKKVHGRDSLRARRQGSAHAQETVSLVFPGQQLRVAPCHNFFPRRLNSRGMLCR